MRGLDMARTYFEEWGLEFLRGEYPSLVDRVAAGIWRGSQGGKRRTHGRKPLHSVRRRLARAGAERHLSRH